ncbi:MAG: DUF4276 family protein [Tissierellales bacterium]|nr:DUF4276 family protein [Tissierellales bacterium]
MVTVKIVVEGGIMPSSNIEAQTIANSERLRESFYKLLVQVIEPEYFNLQIEMGAGEKNACKIFKRTVNENHCSLLIDLDGGEEIRESRLSDLEINDYSEFVFFMIQQMEAWILSQPVSIDKGMTFFTREKQEKVLSEDPIFSYLPYEISQPASKLNTILSRYYSFQKRGVKKKKKYGKLKDAPLFIENLDAKELAETFEDVANLFRFIETTMPNNAS